jgi:hypothetical protein
MASVNVLPSELLARIISFLDRSSLKAIRETSRLLSQFATPRLFDTLRLFPDEESYEAIDRITSHATLKKMVKKVYVNTCEDDYVCPYRSRIDECSMLIGLRTSMTRRKSN